MIIGPRLKTIAKRVLKGKKLADIGTDHAYLPTFLLSENIIDSAIAADINSLPLKNAKETVEQYQLEDKISLRLSNGLREILENEVDQIVIAGMGGEEMISILKNDLDKALTYEQLILQPQSNVNLLRHFIIENGFKIVSEDLAVEGIGKKHYYPVLTIKPGKMEKIDQFQEEYGYLPVVNFDNNYKEFLNYKVEQLKSRLKNMNNSTNQKTIEKAISFNKELEFLERVLNESF